MRKFGADYSIGFKINQCMIQYYPT